MQTDTHKAWWGWRKDGDGLFLIPAQENWKTQIYERPWLMLDVLLAAAERGAALDQGVSSAFQELVGELDELSMASRTHWWSGLARLFGSPKIVQALRLMRQTHLLSFLLPLPSSSVGWDLDQSSNPYHHETVWEHTLSVMRHLQVSLEEAELPLTQRLRLALVAFFHDAGKTVPLEGHQYKADGAIRFVGHPKVSTDIAREALTRLGAAPELRHDVERLVLFHDEILGIREKDLSSSPPPPKLLGLVLRMEQRKDLVHDLAFFAIADRLAHAPGHDDDRLMRLFLKEIMESFEDWQQRLVPLISEEQFSLFLPFDALESLVLLRRHLLWCQQYSTLQSHEEAILHLERLAHLADVAQTTLADHVWLGALLAPMQKAWPSLEKPIEFWVVDHLHRLRLPHEDPKQAELLFPSLLHGRDLLAITQEIANERKGDPPFAGPWIGDALREIALWQLQQKRSQKQATQFARGLLLQRWDSLPFSS